MPINAKYCSWALLSAHRCFWVILSIQISDTLIKMPQSGVGSMQGSNEDERTHTRGGRTHNVTQRMDTHIFTGGGRTHNVIQRTDTQKRTDGLTN